MQWLMRKIIFDIRNKKNIKSSTFLDNELEKVRYKTDAKIREWIDGQMAMHSCLVVVVGYETNG